MSRPGLTIINLLFALPLLGLSWAFLSVWSFPRRIHALTVTDFLAIMIIEFIVIHSSGFLHRITFSKEGTRKKAGTFLGMLAFYLVVAAGVAFGIGSPWLFVSFLGLTVLKLPSVLFSGRPDEKRIRTAGKDWALTAALYLFGIFATAFLPIPKLGLTPDVVKELKLPGSGLWIDEPHRLIAFGCFYFGILGLRDLIAAFRR